MEAVQLKSIHDLEYELEKDERLELINGSIVQRTIPRFEHGQTQFFLGEELGPIRHSSNGGSDGWWFATEVHACYN